MQTYYITTAEGPKIAMWCTSYFGQHWQRLTSFCSCRSLVIRLLYVFSSLLVSKTLTLLYHRWRSGSLPSHRVLPHSLQEERAPSVSNEFNFYNTINLAITLVRTVGLITALVRLTFQTAAPAAFWCVMSLFPSFSASPNVALYPQRHAKPHLLANLRQ